jgi:2-keto-4-pentenoate hydratase/2-oxohepta-3-ene-1,7-dioic acid hydratase in catechol pathway
MKLLRYGPSGQERPGVIDVNGQIRDVSSIVDDIAGVYLNRDSLKALRETDFLKLPLVDKSVRLGPCVGRVRHFIAVGLNYADHAAEANMPVPAEPILFSKAPSCIIGPNDDVIIPKGSLKTDWEIELAIVIGERAQYVSEVDALSIVAGYCICNDVSERDWQTNRGGQWIKGKSAPTFGPIGPWLVTTDEITDPQNLDMALDLNGKKQQRGSTKTMIFGVKHLVSYISQFMALEPGDIITTGTPPGVGMGVKPEAVYLKGGDVMELTVAGLGTQRQSVRVYGY